MIEKSSNLKKSEEYYVYILLIKCERRQLYGIPMKQTTINDYIRHFVTLTTWPTDKN